jgi:hypothetical protein
MTSATTQDRDFASGSHARSRAKLPNAAVGRSPTNSSEHATVIAVGDPSFETFQVMTQQYVCKPLFEPESVVFANPEYSPLALLLCILQWLTGLSPIACASELDTRCRLAATGRKKLVIYARGQNAAMVFTYLCRPDAIKPALVVLEACPASLMEVLTMRYPSWMVRCLAWLLGYATTSDPIDKVTQFPKDVPVLLVASESDRVVPIATCRRLYEALQLRHPSVELQLFDRICNIGHDGYYNINPLATFAYHNLVQTMYDKHVKNDS